MLSRRRPHSSDGEDDDDGMQHDPKRRKEVVNFEQKLTSLISCIGEKSTTSLESNIEGLAAVLEADIPRFGGLITDICLKCATRMPEKLTIYSALIGLLNAKNYSFGSEFVEKLSGSLCDSLKQDFDGALIKLIFLCDLVNSHVISAESCLQMLNTLISAVSDVEDSQLRSDFYAYAILSALPWCGCELNLKRPAELRELLKTIEDYSQRRQRLHVPMLRVWSTNKPHAQEDHLDCLSIQINKLKSDNWQEHYLIRPYLAFQSVLTDALQHSIPNFMPPMFDGQQTYPSPRVVFRMFDSSDCPEEGPSLPDAHSIERFLLELEITWVLRQFHKERKDCATVLVGNPRRTKLPLNYAILEVIFGQLFSLPRTPYLEVFYGSLLIELCKLQPNTMPQVLAQTAEMLYQRIDTMSAACFDKFVNWFSYHLSNFQFRWSWEDWTDCLSADKFSPKQLFVKEVLHKCMRFSYHQRVLDIVPSSFSGLVPPKPAAFFKFAQEGAENERGYAVAQSIAQAIRNKCSPQDLAFMVKDCSDANADMEDQAEDEAAFSVKLDVLFLTLLNFGTKSMSHSFAALAKYHEPLKEITRNNTEAQCYLLKLLYDMWSTNQQMMVVLVDKMLKMQIIECSAVVRWVFSKQLSDDFHRMYVWEIMSMTLSKLNRHLAKIRLEIQLAQKEVQKAAVDSNTEMGNLSERDIEQMEIALESSLAEQKNVYLMLFQQFTILLTEHLVQSEAEGVDYNTYWYRWVIGRFRQMFLSNLEEVSAFTQTLEGLLFTSDVDPHILEIFHQFCALQR